MSNGDDKTSKFVWIALGIFLLLAGASSLIAAINLGATIVTVWVVIAFQILIVLLAAAVTFAVLFFVYDKTVKELGQLRRSHGELLDSFKRRTGAAAAITTLFATAVIFFADKSFEGDKRATLLISIILAIAFWLANELITAKTRLKKVCGFIIWSLGIVLLPVAVMVHRGWSIDNLLSEVAILELRTKVGFASAAFVMVVTPLVLSWRESRT